MTLSDEQMIAHLDAHADKVVVLDAVGRGRVTWLQPHDGEAPRTLMRNPRARRGQDVSRIANWLRSQGLIVTEQGHRAKACLRAAAEPHHRCVLLTVKGADILDRLTA